MTKSRTETPACAVIMAGGSGTRFWPRSRIDRPKQLLDITGDGILLKKSVELIKPLIPSQRIKIVTTRSQQEAVRRIVPEIAQGDIIAEPFGRNTAPAIGISALYVERDHPEAVMVILPADHYIGDSAAFRQVIMAAADRALQGDCIVTIGISPRGPETGYGYIEAGTVIDSTCAIRTVKSFHEKPDLARAMSFIEKGTFFWNSGIFITKASVILREIGEHLPRNHELLMNIRSSLGTDNEQKAIEDAYEMMEAISIDYGVIEKSRKVIMVEGNFGWDDVGCWPSAAQYWPRDSQGNACIGDVINLDSSRCIVRKTDRSQDVRRLVEIVRARGRDDIL
jgi:mannose-1-phosphate guanylyltransferase